MRKNIRETLGKIFIFLCNVVIPAFMALSIPVGLPTLLTGSFHYEHASFFEKVCCYIGLFLGGLFFYSVQQDTSKSKEDRELLESERDRTKYFQDRLDYALSLFSDEQKASFYNHTFN